MRRILSPARSLHNLEVLLTLHLSVQEQLNFSLIPGLLRCVSAPMFHHDLLRANKEHTPTMKSGLQGRRERHCHWFLNGDIPFLWRHAKAHIDESY